MRRRVLVGVAAVLVAPPLLLLAEAGIASSHDFATPDSAPLVRGDYGPATGAPLTLAVLGDSTGAGLGITSGDAADTVGGQVATALAADGRRVALRGFAVSGARARDLAGQVDRVAASRPVGSPLVALVLVGANDATHLTGLGSVRRDVGAAVRRLEALGARVVVGTCPDMGSARAFLQPLRAVAGWRGRAVGAAEGEAVRSAGGEAVDLGALTGAEFRRDPATTSFDRFHPSRLGYAVWTRVLLPAVRRAAG